MINYPEQSDFTQTEETIKPMFRACTKPVEVWLKIKKIRFNPSNMCHPCSKKFALANKKTGK
jgi:hypothetical protein